MAGQLTGFNARPPPSTTIRAASGRLGRLGLSLLVLRGARGLGGLLDQPAALGSGWALPWFELSVLEDNVARAHEVVDAERRRLVEEAPEAARAAEDEERESEAPKTS